MEKFDLIVIGSGPAGFAAAMRAIDFGKHVCIVEKKHVGGAGVMNGALTSKTMWALSMDYAVAANVDRGYRASGLSVDYDKVRQTVLNAAKEKQYQLLSQIETFRREAGATESLTLKLGHARFLDKNTVEVEDKNGDKETIWGKDFVIATGSSPREYPGIEVDQTRIINSDGILNLKKFPERMVIIGAGIIGCEFATMFSNFKQTEVHMIDRYYRVIPFEDDDLSNFVAKNLADNGVQIHHTASLRTIRKKDDILEVVLDYEAGHSRVIEADVALIAIGRVPNTKDLGLENIGIETTDRGFVKINDMCMVDDNPNKAHIFAAGDITGHGQLYNVAETQGRYTSKAMYNQLKFPLSYANMSTLMFFKPEVAAVGLNEKELQQKGTAYRASYYSNVMVNRSIAMRSTRGFVKLMICDTDEQRILGMRAAGPQASAFIVSIAHLIDKGNTIKDIMKIIHPHPSVTEGIQECLRVFSNKSVMKPKAFPELVNLRRWTPEGGMEILSGGVPETDDCN